MKDQNQIRWSMEVRAKVSMVVQAYGKREALMQAASRFGEAQLRRMEIRAVDSKGAVSRFGVERVRDLVWEDAVWSGYTGRYMAEGELKLSMRLLADEEHMLPGEADQTPECGYELCRSMLNHAPHWTVPTDDGATILCVNWYEMELIEEELLVMVS